MSGARALPVGAAPSDAPELSPLLAGVRESLVRQPGGLSAARVAQVARESGGVLSGEALLAATRAVRDHLEGLGPLEPLITDGVTDLLVNPDGRVWVEDERGLRVSAVRLTPGQARDLAVRLAAAGGRRLDDAVPSVDARLPSGARLHALLPPLSTGGTVISLRLPAPQRFTLEQLAATGMIPAPMVPVLRALIARRAAFLVSGGTGTGKSTLLAALLALVPVQERIIVVEDAQELQISHPHSLSLQARHANSEGAGEVGMTELIRHCLRMRPDRIVVGECRGAEIRELLQALNTGHEGGCGTLHANRTADVPARLEALGALGGLDRTALASQAASALEVVLHLERAGTRRNLQEIAVIGRARDGSLRTRCALQHLDGDVLPGPAFSDLRTRLGLDTEAAR